MKQLILLLLSVVSLLAQEAASPLTSEIRSIIDD